MRGWEGRGFLPASFWKRMPKISNPFAKSKPPNVTFDPPSLFTDDRGIAWHRGPDGHTKFWSFCSVLNKTVHLNASVVLKRDDYRWGWLINETIDNMDRLVNDVCTAV